MKETEKIIKNIDSLLYDPTAIQTHILKLLDSNTVTEDVDIPDPSNPFTFLLEANALITTATLNEFSTHMRKLYPILSNKKEELYHHLTMNETIDIFTTPSKAMYSFMIHSPSFKNYGIRTNNYIEIVIPRFTKVTINEIVFTLLNDINIRRYDSSGVFVREMGNNDVLGKRDTTVLEAGKFIDENHEEWLIFSIELSQVRVEEVTSNIIESSAFMEELPFDDYYTDIKISSVFKTGTIEKLNTTYSNFVYDPEFPTVYVKPLNNSVKINIPIIYTSNKSISGHCDIELYTSKGIISEPINNYTPEDFEIDFYKVGSTSLTSSLNSIRIYTKAFTHTYGGRNEIDFTTLKDKIIKHTTGDNIIPITDEEVAEAASKENYIITKDIDSTLNREYVVTKSIDNLGYEINLLADIFMDRLVITDKEIDGKYIQSKDKSIIINPFTIFKHNKDSNTITPLKDNEVIILDTLNTDRLISNINNNRYFYSIYKYILDFKDELLVRAYDLNQPTYSTIRDNKVNNTLESTIFLTEREVKRVGDTYVITFIINSDNGFKQINTNLLKIELGLQKVNSPVPIYYYGDVYEEDNVVKGKVIIDTTGYIDKDNKILLQNFVSNVDVIDVGLDLEVSMFVYTIDDALSTYKTDLNNELYKDTKGVAIYREHANFKFGVFLKYLYVNYTSTFTDRKYLRYTEDVLLTYDKDVYRTDAFGPVLTYNTDSNKAELTIIHHKGDPVLDSDNNFTYKHRKGDVKLDVTGAPIIDYKNGVIHYVNILLLEYQYKAATNPLTKKYIIDIYKRLTDMATVELETLNNKLLDNTVIKYKPTSNLKNVQLLISDIPYVSSNFRIPVVTLYLNRDDLSLTEYSNYLRIIGLTIQDGLRNKIKISSIADNIVSIIGDNVVSVNISNLDDYDDLDVKKYNIDSSDIVLTKSLSLDEVGTTSITHDIELKIIKI